MLSASFAAFIALFLLVLLWLTVPTLVSRFRHGNSHPPGPPGYPLLGHLSFPPHPPWKVFARWSKIYGSDILYYRIFGKDIILLNSFEVATDLLDKRSSIYSDRDISGLVMLRELAGLAWTFAFQRYGREWRDGRKAFQQEYNTESVKRFRPSATKATLKFIRQIISTPEEFFILTRELAGGRMVYTTYGIETKGLDDPWIATSEQVTSGVSAMLMPGNYWVDFIPALRYVPEWVPGAGFQKQARIWRYAMNDMLHKPFDFVKKRLAAGQEVPDCAAKSLIETSINGAKDPAYTETIVKGALASMYGAGTDTVNGTLVSFFLAMAQYPDVQRKAQDTIDTVCHGRLPAFSDHNSLPYVEGVVKECLRWNPVATLTIGHMSTQDDTYRGYHLSKGSILVANIWAILHDPQTYPNPDEFAPERFLTADKKKINTEVLDPAEAAFGFGRRICPGLHMAYETLWIAIASVLAVCSVNDAVDENGCPVALNAENREGFVSLPKPFRCQIRARSTMHEQMLNIALQE